ncbi:stage II sporulation protein M [Pyrococcus sp. ST04]|uniref:stage II sporulation protein M n=1 Tax=Pyrococcus sp. ST04 TaxID=1183377 RepID=UPI0002605D67|nr:stage II sporulation protein M [Pyrococcus sp. ST04]AFK23085.1 putative SpoIIM-like stage II sporulation protein M related protein [Pyrococcus sp. ST04]
MGRKVKIFLALLLTFFMGVLLGTGVARSNPLIAQEFFKFIKKLLGGGELPQGFRLFLMIFLNNTRVAVIMTFGGLIFGVVPFLIMLFNGYVVGVVASYVAHTGKSLSTIILSLVPHGIVEIPALLIAGVGGVSWFLEIVHGEGEIQDRFKRGLKEALKLLAVSIFLLFIAALIEAFITPKIAGIS